MNQIQQPKDTLLKPATQRARCCAPVAKDSHAKDGTSASALGQTRDPVCGMAVDPVTSKMRTEYDGETYYFCCAGCRAKFLANPTQYLNPHLQSAPTVPSTPSAPGTIYTCPMHP